MKVYSVGTFDLLTPGHIDLFYWCRKIAGDGEVIISLNTDEFVEQFKGHKPSMCYEDRKAILEALSMIDMVIPNSGGADSKPAILNWKPDVIVVGSDWLKKDYCKQMGFTPEWLEEQKIALMYIPRHLPQSSTLFKEKIKNG